MRNSFRFAPAFVIVLAVIFVFAPAMLAQQYDSVRVVRVSRVEGQVLVSHPGSGEWEEALVNLPLQEGDTLATQGGYAEVEFENGATSYLADNSTVQFTQLGFSSDGGRATELTLTEGAGTFYANPASQDSFRVVTPTMDVAIAGRAQCRVDVFPDGAAVETQLGTVTVSTTRGSTQLEKGQSLAVHASDLQDFSIGRLPEPDPFDQWVTEEGEIIRSGNKNSLTYINSPNYYGLADLSIYGTWINLPGFGISWRPFSTGLSWAPYRSGVWILDARLGWVWVSNEPWGWIPYHFGTWQLSPTLGWVWIPGGPAGLRQWEPARVNWVRANGQVGWVAKSPNDRDGVAANLPYGVMTRPGRSARAENNANEILSGKALQGATPLKGPPPEFTPRAPAGVQRVANPSAHRPAPPMPNANSSIVFDRATRTFINRDEASAPESNAHAMFVPRSSVQSEIPRVTIPSTGAIDSRTNRVLLPPPYPTVPASRATAPASGLPTASRPMTPVNSSPRPLAPVVAPPRVTTPPRSAPPPPTPRPMQSQIGSASRPATATAQPRPDSRTPADQKR